MDLETFEILADNVYQYIQDTCIGEVGIYRVPGSAQQSKEIYEQYLKGNYVDLKENISDPFTATTLLKYAITQLKNQIFPHSLYPVLRAILLIKEQQGRVPKDPLQKYLLTVPEINLRVLTKLVKHLKIVSLAKERNQMGLVNLLIVFGPSLLKGYNENPLEEMKANPAILKIVFDEIIQQNNFNNVLK